jgi:hypothetical protein
MPCKKKEKSISEVARNGFVAVPVTRCEVNEVVFAEIVWLQAFQKNLTSVFRKSQVRFAN